MSVFKKCSSCDAAWPKWDVKFKVDWIFGITDKHTYMCTKCLETLRGEKNRDATWACDACMGDPIEFPIKYIADLTNETSFYMCSACYEAAKTEACLTHNCHWIAELM